MLKLGIEWVLPDICDCPIYYLPVEMIPSKIICCFSLTKKLNPEMVKEFQEFDGIEISCDQLNMLYWLFSLFWFLTPHNTHDNLCIHNL